MSKVFFGRLLASLRLTAFLSMFLVLSTRTDVAMAKNDLVMLKADLEQLKAATSITLMVVPYGVAFAVRLNEKRLPANSCVYQIQSAPGQASDDVIKVLNESVLEYEEGTNRNLEVRIGVVFKNGNSVLRDFYFQDWGGKSNVNGFSGKFRIVATADFPTRIRALLVRPDVIFINGRGGDCPHS